MSSVNASLHGSDKTLLSSSSVFNFILHLNFHFLISFPQKEFVCVDTVKVLVLREISKEESAFAYNFIFYSFVS